MQKTIVEFVGSSYRHVLKPVLFQLDPELVHENMVGFGEALGSNSVTCGLMKSVFVRDYPNLEINLAGIKFKTPIGLAAGFDYKAKLTQVLPAIGMGFGTVGTITNLPCEGNARPRLGRLPKSRSLLVNKGFRNPGADAIIKKLDGLSFEYPVGISLGVTNTPNIKTLQEAIDDVAAAFIKFKLSNVKNSYYELNISCPNLQTTVSFYDPKNLQKLLKALDTLKLKKPVFIKLPISKTNTEFLKILEVVTKFKIPAVIVGNLQTHRDDPSLDHEEVMHAGKGNFSGKPTFDRSNELISLTAKKYGDKLKIIGCGGVFTASDAKEKMDRGATLIQMITGMIYEGPQVVSQINEGLNSIL